MKRFTLGKLEVAIDREHALLAGRIDDHSPLGELLAQLPEGNVSIDTAGVTFVNSVGMREWVRMLRALAARPGSSVTLERVADVLIKQMNLLSDFGRVRIGSFYAEYVCNACGAEAAMLIDAVAHAELLAQMKVPSQTCPECGGAMELADFPQRYVTLFKA